jgi:hypothetical protein
LVTTQNTWLSIAGIEANISSKAGEESSGVPANTKLTITACEQASPYSNNAYPCANAFHPSGTKFSLTNRGVGMWWRANFGKNYWVDRVRIKNRHNCCGDRLAGTMVLIGGKECGKVEAGTTKGKWYTVKCQ